MPRALPAPLLDEWYVISLRPLGRHAGVRRAAARFGACVFSLSTLAVEPLAAGAALKEALACSNVIVTSPSAARTAHAQSPLKWRRRQHWLAVGAGTATALRRCGIKEVCIPEQGADSEALLALPALADVAGQSVGLITAPGGRGLLASALAARGARICVAEVYRRRALTPTASRLRAMAALPSRTALLVSSGEALAGLWTTLTERDRARLVARLCVVSSDRLGQQARTLGFERRVLAADATPNNLMAALAAHVGRQRFR